MKTLLMYLTGCVKSISCWTWHEIDKGWENGINVIWKIDIYVNITEKSDIKLNDNFLQKYSKLSGQVGLLAKLRLNFFLLLFLLSEYLYWICMSTKSCYKCVRVKYINKPFNTANVAETVFTSIEAPAFAYCGIVY